MRTKVWVRISAVAETYPVVGLARGVRRNEMVRVYSFDTRSPLLGAKAQNGDCTDLI